MHESRLVAQLVTRAEAFALDAGRSPARIGIRIGALSGVREGALRTYWDRYAGPIVGDATLDVVTDDDPLADGAFGVDLTYLEVARGVD